MATLKDTNKCCAVDIEKCDTFDFMANVIGLPVLHPGGLKATDEMAKLCNINKDTRVLDIACARGANDVYLAERFGCSVTGIDFDENLINEAKELAKKKGLEDKLTFKVEQYWGQTFKNHLLTFDNLDKTWYTDKHGKTTKDRI